MNFHVKYIERTGNSFDIFGNFSVILWLSTMYFIYRKDFEDHEISQYVTGECRDVCETGFGLNNVADAGMKIIQ